MSEFSEDYEQEAEYVTKEIIEKMILERMPDRIEGKEDLAFLDEIIEDVGDRLALLEAKEIAAAALVKRVWENLARKVNNHLRKWITTGQWPLDPMDMAKMPIVLDGKGRKAKIAAMDRVDWNEAIAYQAEKGREAAAANEQLLVAMMELRELIGAGNGHAYFIGAPA
jgi:hypothetical protein